MELFWLYILLGDVLKFASGIVYNKKGESTSRFACYTHAFIFEMTESDEIKLYLENYLRITCHLYDINIPDIPENRRKNRLLYTSLGLSPSIQIFNSTYSQVFYFDMIQENEETDTWSIEIPREKIAYSTDVAPVEEWFVVFNMHHGLGMFTTKGTLLDVMREPILQWIAEFADYINIYDTITDITKFIVTKSPCASDVALIGVIYNDRVTGIVIGITEDGFVTAFTTWYNLTDNICTVLDYDCANLVLVDIILMNTRLVILTSLGLFISEDLCHPTREKMKFIKPSLCGFEMDDYLKAAIWYNRQCLANREAFEVDYAGLSFDKDKTLSQESTCFYSDDSFTKWHSCLPQAGKQISRRVVSFIVDYEQNTGIALLSQQNRALVSVHKLTDGKMNRKTKFPAFWFPDLNFVPSGLFFHQGSHFLYAYGNQVWNSFDGANSFQPLILLMNETVIAIDFCVYTQAILFVTDKGNLYYNKAGSKQYTRLKSVPPGVYFMYFDHLGLLNEIHPNDSSPDGLSVSPLDVKTLMKEEDLGFDSALAPQFITEQEMVLFLHEKGFSGNTFSGLQYGKLIVYEPGGSGLIKKAISKALSPGFISAVNIDIQDHFPIESDVDSPCTGNALLINPIPANTSYRLHLATAGTHIFRASDLGKTVVIPGSSSLFITQVLGDMDAIADATMPGKVPLNQSIEPTRWFMYDFGLTTRRKWKIVVDSCRYVIQQFDDLPLHAIKYLDLGSSLHFTFRVTPVNTAYKVFRMNQMRLLIGKPFLLDITAEDYWDDTNSYLFNITVQSRFFQQGKTSLAVSMPYASLLCDVLSIIMVLKNSCFYLKAMHYVLPYKISTSEWLATEEDLKHDPSMVSKFLKILPVNYRPPSLLGIAIPLTDNFYNADPSKPRMRDYFEESKASGKYKQCANKLNRAECNCNNDMKLSFSVAFSDCKEKALRMKFPVEKLALYFTVEDEGYSANLTSPYFVTIEEINNRTNWIISGTKETSSMIKLREHLEGTLKTKLYNPEGFAISITGSELFHFRVSTIPGVSFCNLFDEFQIYVDDAPLAFPGQYLISTLVAILFGGVIFVAFLLHVYEVQIENFLKEKLHLRKNKVATNVSSFATSGSIET